MGVSNHGDGVSNKGNPVWKSWWLVSTEAEFGPACHVEAA